ncbi:MAG TPA: type II toxin-antitoxin system HigB family toxin, partial [Phycisphaerae bacterium]|nr:type II toxin-antitoxin system HigB family toxin [Phycisphaerae bacterium]
MRIISYSRLKEYSQKHRQAKGWLGHWHDVVKNANWRKITEVRRTFPSASVVTVDSGKSTVVFNVCGDRYRLVTAIHYDRQRLYILWFGTHAEYS